MFSQIKPFGDKHWVTEPVVSVFKREALTKKEFGGHSDHARCCWVGKYSHTVFAIWIVHMILPLVSFHWSSVSDVWCFFFLVWVSASDASPLIKTLCLAHFTFVTCNMYSPDSRAQWRALGELSAGSESQWHWRGGGGGVGLLSPSQSESKGPTQTS